MSSSLFLNGEVGSDGGLYIVRALAALYERNTTTSNLREYIKEYIGVQVSLRRISHPRIDHLFYLTV